MTDCWIVKATGATLHPCRPHLVWERIAFKRVTFVQARQQIQIDDHPKMNRGQFAVAPEEEDLCLTLVQSLQPIGNPVSICKGASAPFGGGNS